jgi:hypothetical protein
MHTIFLFNTPKSSLLAFLRVVLATKLSQIPLLALSVANVFVIPLLQADFVLDFLTCFGP